jgi:hypothetical protein
VSLLHTKASINAMLTVSRKLSLFTLHRGVFWSKPYLLHSCAGICQDLIVDTRSLPSRSPISSLSSGNSLSGFCLGRQRPGFRLLSSESSCFVPFLQILVNNDVPVVALIESLAFRLSSATYSAYRLRVARKLSSRPIFLLGNIVVQGSSGEEQGSKQSWDLELLTEPENLMIFRVSGQAVS